MKILDEEERRVVQSGRKKEREGEGDAMNSKGRRIWGRERRATRENPTELGAPKECRRVMRQLQIYVYIDRQICWFAFLSVDDTVQKSERSVRQGVYY